ncbi:MAG: hypothetical protein KAU02_06455 [Tenericutes bacterium]|nr:hypothetical protein [Mycoplasmatota bacterium]
MKKFFGSFFVLVLVLLISIVAVPWNNLSQFGVAIPIIEDYEIYIKGGVFALAFIFSLIYLIISNSEYNNYGHVNVNTSRAAFLPLYLFSIGILIYGGALNYFIYQSNPSTTNLLILAFFGFVILNLIIYGHIFGKTFKKESNIKRVMHYILIFQIAAVSAGLTYWYFYYRISSLNYSSFDSLYFAGVAAFGILMYLVHIIFFTRNKKGSSFEEELEEEIDEMTDSAPKPKRVNQDDKPRRRRKDKKEGTFVAPKDGKKTMIVSNQQTIVSSEQNIDPTNMIYEDVSVDPEFTKTSPSSTQPNSIEYYIEKPKMFKPLDPSFDELVAYVRELPQTVTKLDDDKITFYIDRKPFLVLMNYGNYYRIAFKYDLEKGIRLIIKYPTISKNKSTREELWFKANNYGDIPKEVVYQIVKSSYDSVNL